MIIFTLILGAILSFLSFVYIRSIGWKIFCTIISVAILGFSIVFLVLNDYSHYGMYQKTTSQTKRIYPVSSTNNMDLVLYRPLGSKGTENIQLYKNKASQKKPSHTQANEYTASHNHVKQTKQNKAYLKNQETRWEYKKGSDSFWFSIAGNGHKLVKRTNTFYLPKKWLHLSTSQAKALQKQMAKQKTPAAQAKIKQQAKTYVQGKMKAAVAKNPKLATNKKAQAQLTKQYTQEFRSNLIKRAVQQIKK